MRGGGLTIISGLPETEDPLATYATEAGSERITREKADEIALALEKTKPT